MPFIRKKYRITLTTKFPLLGGKEALRKEPLFKERKALTLKGQGYSKALF